MFVAKYIEHGVTPLDNEFYPCFFYSPDEKKLKFIDILEHLDIVKLHYRKQPYDVFLFDITEEISNSGKEEIVIKRVKPVLEVGDYEVFIVDSVYLVAHDFNKYPIVMTVYKCSGNSDRRKPIAQFTRSPQEEHPMDLTAFLVRNKIVNIREFDGYIAWYHGASKLHTLLLFKRVPEREVERVISDELLTRLALISL